MSFLWVLASRPIVSRTIATWLLSSATLLLAALDVATQVIIYSSCCALRNLKKRETIEMDALISADYSVSAKSTCSFDFLAEPVVACFTLEKPWITWSKKEGKCSRTDSAYASNK